MEPPTSPKISFENRSKHPKGLFLGAEGGFTFDTPDGSSN